MAKRELKPTIEERINLTEKFLPRDSQGNFTDFVANGKKYYAYTFKDYMPPKRYIAMEKWSLIAKSGYSYEELIAEVEYAKECNRSSLKSLEGVIETELVLNSIITNVRNKSEAKFYALYTLACVFLVREDEDITDWNEELQEQKINDLIAEGYDCRSFF